jgi:hypothetical protein
MPLGQSGVLLQEIEEFAELPSAEMPIEQEALENKTKSRRNDLTRAFLRRGNSVNCSS